MNFLLMQLLKNFNKTLDAPLFLAQALFQHLAASRAARQLLRALFIWLRRSGIALPLHRPYDNPYAVLRRRPHSFTIRVRSRDKIVSVSRLKACTEVDATPGSLRHRSRLPGKRPGGPATTKRVSFSDPQVISPSSPPAAASDGPGTVFPVTDRQRHSSLHSSSTRTISGHCLRD
jgi:hypothetical protein